MTTTLKSEYLKLLTVRSTYITMLLAFLLIALFSFYFEGFRGVTGSPASTLQTTAIREIIVNSAGLVAAFITIVTILLMAHEYRYNTINYSLTLVASRTKFLLSKSIVAVTFGVVFGFLGVFFALVCYFVGLSLRDATLPAQQINYLEFVGKGALYFAVYALIGLILATIIRSLVGAIVFFFIVPVTVEPLLGAVLKNNTGYLPFTMFDSIIRTGVIKSELTASKIAIFAVIYIIIGWIIAWLLFMRRDAN